MARTEYDRTFFARCRACGAAFVAKQRLNGTIRPVGVPAKCTCGDGDFQQIPA